MSCPPAACVFVHPAHFYGGDPAARFALSFSLSVRILERKEYDRPPHTGGARINREKRRKGLSGGIGPSFDAPFGLWRFVFGAKPHIRPYGGFKPAAVYPLVNDNFHQGGQQGVVGYESVVDRVDIFFIHTMQRIERVDPAVPFRQQDRA